MTEDKWPPMKWDSVPESIRPPSTREMRRMRFLILCGMTLLITFFVWLLKPEHRGNPWLDYTLLFGLGLLTINLLLEWRYYWSMKVPKARIASRAYTVDILTTSCPGEPRGMIIRTLEAMQKITYPHNSFLCDEGDDPILKEACERLGVTHVTRSKKEHAKAGNINSALRTVCKGEITIILDPDHEPAPFFIDRILGYFDDDTVGFVQTIQAYRNQSGSIIAHEAAQMQYHFYGPIQMGMNGLGTPQAIGANCAFRRAALDSIGGHASGLAEDMHTTMQLYAKGWKGRYVPEVLTRGLVPQTLAAFYKQQLKWSCGTFDLFFQVLPKVFRSLQFNQKVHFLLCPVYFMQGWITLASTLVPVSCLLFGGVAWKIKTDTFVYLMLPLISIIVITRSMAQRFVLNKSERGLHIKSGLLANGSWWVFCTGNLCALFRKKIPYLPTPKDDEPEDAWKLALPNFAVALICLSVIPYGLLRDFSPYTMLMAVFALWNAVSLLAVAMQGQQQTTQRVYEFCCKSKFLKHLLHYTKRISLGPLRPAQDLLLAITRTAPVIVTTIILAISTVAAVIINNNQESYAMPWMHLVKENKEIGGFYSGYYERLDIAELNQLTQVVDEAEKQLQRPIDIVSLYMAWGPQTLLQFPKEALEATIQTGSIPMITWEPWTVGFPWTHKQGHPLASNKGIFRAIANGTFDYHIEVFADKLRDLEGPVFLRYGHEMDNPQYPWSPVGGDTPEDYIAAWRRVVSLFHQRGASNVAFVYNPWRGEAIDRYYPGDDYVDWIGLTLLNYGTAGRDGQWHSFEQLYSEFDYHVKHYNKPVMLAEFGTTSYGGNPGAWLADAMKTIKTSYPQIKAAVLFHSDQDHNWATEWRPYPGAIGIDWSVLNQADARQTLREGFAQWGNLSRKGSIAQTVVEPIAQKAETAKQLKGTSGKYWLEVDGEPFFIKGVAYNPGHDWRDGGELLNREKIEKDFDAIKAMGGNTIRRYSGGWADYNLFKIAEEKDLKILYGLWLKQDVNYIEDKDILNEYEQGFIEKVHSLKNSDALLGWVIGNEVWGMFKHSYQQPYITDMRIAYVRFVEKLAKQIKAIDPERPVFVACENSEELAGAISDYTTYAPSVDVIGINTYYDTHYRMLPQMMTTYGKSKPYIVSEFGPQGYWHPNYTPRSKEGLLNEPAASQKALLYAKRWNEHIEGKQGLNLGGFAYCWSERYEGSSTWFGLVDSEGRKKPGYYALQKAYTGKTDKMPEVKISEMEVSKRRLSPNEVISLKLNISNNTATDLEINWKVVNNNYQKVSAEIQATRPDSSAVTIRMPQKAGTYWLHATILEKDRFIDEQAFSVEVLATEKVAKAMTASK